MAAACGLGRLRRHFLRARSAAEVWSERAATAQAGAARHWTELGQVRDVINLRVSGDRAVDPYLHFLRTRLADRLPVARALTIGCGAGELERGLCQYGFASRHDAFDVAPKAVAVARAAAADAGHLHLSYFVADGNTVRLEPGAYDVAFGVHSVHHVSNLEHLFGELASALKDDGFLFLNEFVGPTRFQWTDRQLEVVNGLLRCIPEALRLDAPGGRVKTKARRPSRGEVIATDPSEAVRSAEILGVVSSFFDILEVRPYGGTVLQLLLEGIAGNFARGEGGERALLEAVCDLEWALVASGELPSDFAVVVAKPRRRGGGGVSCPKPDR